MYFKTSQLGILLLIISICVIRVTCSSKPFYKLIPAIKISTSEVKPVSTELNPFTFEISLSGALSLSEVENTGDEIRFYKKGFTNVRISGGLLPEGVYFLVDRVLLLNQAGPRSTCGLYINDHVYSLVGVNVFCKPECGSVENGTKYDNCCVFLYQPVVGGLIDNPLFFNMEKILKSGALEKPKSSTFIPTVSTFDFYDSLFISHAYFRVKVGKIICLVTQPPYNYMTEDQFKMFRYVLDDKGKPLNTTVQIQDVKYGKIEASRGIRAVVLPFGLTVTLP